MTVNVETFDSTNSTASHKISALPSNVRITNLENGRTMIVRVNDHGPIVPGRITNQPAGCAKRLGFYRQGTVKVLVDTMDPWKRIYYER